MTNEVGLPDSSPLPPLPPGDYSRSAQNRRYEESTGWKRQVRAAHRSLPDIPFWTAPVGYCRWCGEDIGARLKDGRIDTRARWHPRCSAEYNGYSPAIQRDRLWERETGVCAVCLRFCPKRSTSRPDVDQRTIWRGPREATHYRLWACDHIVPLIDGGPNEDENLQLLCEPCHKEKTAREAAERAAKRRATRPVEAAEVTESDQPTLFADAG